MKQSALWSLVFGLAVTVLIACNKNDNNSGNNNQNIVAKTGLAISGDQEVPAKTTNGSGTMNVSYDKSTKMLTISATWQNLSGDPQAAHIHGPASRGENAGVLLDFHDNVNGAAGNFNRTVSVDGSSLVEADLLAGKYYFNIHTAANPAGEIRGQIEF